ncbi:MAG: thioredoxin [Candidatus Aenigmatarchaeota archaeon]
MSEDKELEKIKRKKLNELMKRYGLESSSKKIPSIIEVNDSNFRENVIELSKKIPVLVDFYADWCYPCKILSPVLEKIVKENSGKIVLAKINVDKSPITAGEFGIMSVPTVILFKDGEAIDRFVGALPEPYIKEWLKEEVMIV